MDEDAELAAIRAARLADLQGGQGSQGGGGDKQAQEAESRKAIIAQVCTPEAVDRLGRIALVKAERAQDLENRIVALARTNQLRGRLTDDELIKLIGMVDDSKKKAGGGSGQGEIVFQRRRAAFDDEDDDFFN